MEKKRLLLITAAVLFWSFPGCGLYGENETPKNLILLISDGCGPSSFTMTREYKRIILDDGQLVMDPFLIGTVHTRAADTRLADSAAAGTAYACGVKTNKGYVGMDADGQPVGTLLEAAERAGKWTGAISTSGITDATPGAFTAHNIARDDQTDIAAQQIRGGFELLLGGGRTYFQTREQEGQRETGDDLIAAAGELGYQYVSNRDELLGPVELPLLGLFARDHMAFEIDRDETDQPSLTEMLSVALELFSDAENGFILIVETEGTDDTGHGNDSAANVKEVLSFEKAVRLALEFAEKDGETLVVSASDHDSGGMAIGVGGYEWTPEVLQPIELSASRFGQILRESLLQSPSEAEFKGYVREQVERLFSISDLSDDQWSEIDRLIADAFSEERNLRPMGQIAGLIKEEISRRAGIGWTTGGHTGVDVNLYAFGPSSLAFRGSLDNADVGRKFAEVMGLDLDATTSELRSSSGD